VDAARPLCLTCTQPNRSVHGLLRPSIAGRRWRYVLAEYALARPVQARIGRGGRVLRSCAHAALTSVAVKTYPRYERDEASLQNDGQSWEFFDTYGFRVDALEDGEQSHVSMLHVPFSPWQRIRANSQGDV
jgi:hypothetical protein